MLTTGISLKGAAKQRAFVRRLADHNLAGLGFGTGFDHRKLPKALVEKMGLSAGDELNIVDVVERTLVVQKEDRRKAALERLASLNWTLPPDYKFDRDEANER